MAALASFRLSIDKPSLLRYAAVHAVIELCRAARVFLPGAPDQATQADQADRPSSPPRVRKKADSVDPFGRIELGHQFDQDFVSAFLEVLNNVVLHAHLRAEEPIDVVGEFSANEVRVDICHFGLPFDMRPIVEPDLEALPEGGMGLFIAKSLLDELRYEPGASKPMPNRWILTKRLPSSKVAESQP